VQLLHLIVNLLVGGADEFVGRAKKRVRGFLDAIEVLDHFLQVGEIRFHSINQRCARWLLICEDRVRSKTFDLTQEYLAEMIGVRRPGVTVAARGLKEAGLIKYSRGRVEILDRRGLEKAACECYRRIRDRELELLGNR